LRPYQTWQTAGPDWIDPPHQEFYEIVAKAGEPVTEDRLRLMLQALLAERFGLVVRRESKVLSVLAVTSGTNAPMLTRSSQAEGDGLIKPSGVNEFRCEAVPMPQLAEFLGRIMHIPAEARPVVDQTGLSGHFDFTLDIQRYYDDTPDNRGRVDMEGNVRRALNLRGLKLVSTHAPVEILIIDHADRLPFAN
jgi:uncharacterized protein (TIGR03435 family)